MYCGFKIFLNSLYFSDSMSKQKSLVEVQSTKEKFFYMYSVLFCSCLMFRRSSSCVNFFVCFFRLYIGTSFDFHDVFCVQFAFFFVIFQFFLEKYNG